MKRVLIFSTAYLPLVGGAEVALKELTDRLTDVEFDMVTAMIKPGLPKEEMVGRVKVHRLGSGHALDKWLLPQTALKKAEELHAAKPFDLTFVLMASYAAFAAERFKRRHPEVPMLLNLQEGDPLDYIAARTRFVRPWFLNIFRRADALQSISTYLDRWGKENGFKGKESVVIHNGCDVARFSRIFSGADRQGLRREYGLSPDDFVVVTTSRLVVKNGVDLLIAAMPQQADGVKLLIAGTGELESDLRAQVARLDVADRVVFAGNVPQADLPLLLAASDVFCRPSRSEGMGISFVEAMAAGLPTVGTPVGGITDVIHDGIDGLMVTPSSSKAVADALHRLHGDPELRKKLSDGGREAARRFDWKVLAQDARALIGRLT